MKLIFPYLLAPLLGAIAVGGFHPFEYWFLPLVSLMAIAILAENRSLKNRIGIFYLYGLGFLGPLLHWSSTYVGSIPWLILFFGFASFYVLLAFGYRNGKVHVVAFPAIFVIAEGLRAIAPFGGFGWGRFGFAQLNGPFQEWLRVGGVSLAGFVVALAVTLLARRDRLSVLAIPLGLISLFALPAANAAEKTHFDKSSRIALIQGGVSQLGLSFNATPQEVFDRHFEVTESTLSENYVDLVLWPENASDIDPIQNQELRERIRNIALRSKTPLVIGAVTQGVQGPENVSLHFDENGDFISRYQKRDLVPFGEYVPLRSIATRISSLADTVKDFVPGTEILTHKVDNLSFAPLICYEILDDRTTYDNLSVSNLGVVQTNNATFGRSWQSGQQFQITRVRAFESRIPFIVAATTGDTAYIDSEGKTGDRLRKYKSGSLIVEVTPSSPLIPPITPEAMLIFAAIIFLISQRSHFLFLPKRWLDMVRKYWA